MEEFSLKAMDWRFQGGPNLEGDEVALDCGIQESGEEMRGLEFTGLDRLKEKNPLRFGEEIYAIRRYRPMAPSLPLNEVKDELRDLRSPDDGKAIRVFDSFFSHAESDFNDKLSDPFEEDCDQG